MLHGQPALNVFNPCVDHEEELTMVSLNPSTLVAASGTSIAPAACLSLWPIDFFTEIVTQPVR